MIPTRDPESRVLAYVELGPAHMQPGKTHHLIGARVLGPFTRLQIEASPPADTGVFLYYYTEQGQAADTWHSVIEDALFQAEYEFNVKPEEWTICSSDNRL